MSALRPRFSLRILFAIITAIALFCWWFLVPTQASKLRRLRAWLVSHEHELSMFTDFIPNVMPPEQLSEPHPADFLSAWLDNPEYDLGGYRFESIATDGAGGHFTVWYRPKETGPLPLIFFDSEGGYCVLTKSIWEWPMIMAHGVGANEYDVFDETRTEPVRVDPLTNEWLPHPEPRIAYYAGDASNIKAHAAYREAVVSRYGSLPPLDELIAGRELLSAELHGWVERNRR